MRPGLELEALILEKIFGFPRKKIFSPYEGSSYQWYIPSGKPRRTHEIDAKPVPWFSRSMDAAWDVVIEMRKKGWRVSLSEVADGEWNCRFCPEDTSKYVFKIAATPTMAICLAALEAYQ
jgi:hypothetical protein